MSTLENPVYIQEKLIGEYGDVVTFRNINNKLEAVLTKVTPPVSKMARLYVNTPDVESTVIVTNGGVVLTSPGTYEEFVPSDTEITTSDDYEYAVAGSTRRIFLLPTLGDWVVGIRKGGLSQTTTVNIPSAGTYEVSLSYFNAYIEAEWPAGTTCTCECGETKITAPTTNGNYTFVVNKVGDWVLTWEYGGDSYSEVHHITSPEEYIEVNLVPDSINNCSWELIQLVTQNGMAPSYWDVGDYKEIVLNGTVTLSNSDEIEFHYERMYAIIIGFDYKTESETGSKNTISFAIGRLSDTDVAIGDGFVMNSTATANGWADSYMRNTTMPQLLTCLGDIVSVFMEVSKTSTTKDKLFLPSVSEITDSENCYPYYATSGNRVKYDYTNTSTAVNYWTRTVDTSANFMYINTSGISNTDSANESKFISPIFVVG